MLVWIGAALIGLSWLLPGHYFPWLGFQQEFAAALGAALIGTAVALRRQTVNWPALSILALGTALVPLIQYGLGHVHFFSDAVLASAYVAGFALCVAAGATLGRDDSSLVDALAFATVLAAIASVGMALVQWLQLQPVSWVEPLRGGSRPYANIGQPNHLSSIIAIGMIGLLRWFEIRRIGRASLLLGASFLGLGMLLTQSRTGWLVFALCVAWLTLSRQVRLRTPPVALVGALLVFSALTLVWGHVNEALSLTGPDLASARLEAGTRPLHWAALWDAAWRRPWTGYGWTQVTYAHQAVALDHPFTGEHITNSHNVALDLLIWNGFPLGAMIIASLIFWFVRHLMACRDGEQALLLCIVIALGTHAMVEYPLEYAFFLLPLGFWMGTLDSKPTQRVALAGPGWSFAVPLALLIALQLRIGVEYLRTEEAARTLRFVVFGIGVDKVPTAPEPDVWLLDRPKQFHRYMLSQAQEGLSEHDLRNIDRVARRHPSPSSLFRLAVVQGINGNPVESRRTLALICRIQSNGVCLDVRNEWPKMQERFPKLRVIDRPEMPEP
jgi:O-antigen ligase